MRLGVCHLMVVFAVLVVGCLAEPADLGAIKTKDGGLPGYDINLDGKADHFQFNYDYFVDYWAKGGFNYTGGTIEIKKPASDIVTLPPMRFASEFEREDFNESFMTFAAKNEEAGICSIRVTYRTYGDLRSPVDYYSVFIRRCEGHGSTLLIQDEISGRKTDDFEVSMGQEPGK